MSKALFSKGFDHVAEYIKNKYGDEEDPSSCWNGARFFFHHYNMKCDIDDEDAYPNDLKLDESSMSQRFNNNGIYHCFIENPTEFHHFLLIVQNDELTLIQTYGGIAKLTIQSFNKKDWIDNLIKTLKGDIKAYKYIFQIPTKISFTSKNVTLECFKYNLLPHV